MKKILAASAILTCLSGNAVADEVYSRQVDISFAKSPFSDFLFYILDRRTASYNDLSVTVPLADVPAYERESFLPEDAILSGITSYAQLYEHAATDDDHVRLAEILHKAEPHYAAFESYWRAHIAPDEDRVAQEWRQQNRNWQAVVHLEQLERLHFPFTTIRIDLMALQPQASSMQGPPTIFTTLTVPSLAWAIGHEGTHMMLGPKGANWQARENAPEAIAQMKAAGGSDYDIEEALCLLMQAKLSIAAGVTPANYLTSSDLEPSPRKTLLMALERDWNSYLQDRDANAADWLIAETRRTFPAPERH